MKKIVIWGAIALAALPISPVRAGRIEPTPVSCWFLRSEEIELEQTCTYESVSWLGGGGSTLLWEDGVKTTLGWGLQGRGRGPCGDDWRVDGVCGPLYYRIPNTFEIIYKAERDRRVMNNLDVVNCVRVNDNSVCWVW